MKLRRRPLSALLLVLPALHVLALTAAGEIDDKRVARPEGDTRDLIGNVQSGAAAAKKPTKDAPVDGLDGKPHEGPYVDGKPGDRKPVASIEELPTPPKGAKQKPAKDKPPQDDGVMSDPTRISPKGKTGTEGGVSAKDKDRKAKEHETGERIEKIPDPPKEARPLPHSEQQSLKKPSKEGTKDYKSGAQGLEACLLAGTCSRLTAQKPADLPDSLHDMPRPIPPSLPKDDKLDVVSGHSATHDDDSDDEDDDDASGVIQPLHSFILSFTMIIFSEIGDKTFLVAALMAMRHPRLVVFTAAFSALIVMTVLSAILGHAVPTLLPKRFTNIAASVLFLVFGAKLLREGLAMAPDEGVGEEMKEVEMELEEKEHLARSQNRRKSSISPYVLESGRTRRSRSSSRLPAPARSPSSSPARAPTPGRSSLAAVVTGLHNLFSLLLSPAWVQTFVMTFLGEWGDRSQIATVAMAAGQDYWWVTGGAMTGHGLCTAAAVLGGRAVAGKVSMRVGK